MPNQDPIREILEELAKRCITDHFFTKEEIDYCNTLIRAENKRQMMEWVGLDENYKQTEEYNDEWICGYNQRGAEIRKRVEEVRG